MAGDIPLPSSGFIDNFGRWHWFPRSNMDIEAIRERLSLTGDIGYETGLALLAKVERLQALAQQLAEAIRDGSDQRLLDALAAYEAVQEEKP